MKLFLLLMILWSGYSFGQTYNPYYGSVVAGCDYDTVQSNLNEFVGFGVKEIGTPALDITKNWIIDKYTSYGYTDIVEQPFMYSGSSTSNIIVTKTGSVYPNTYLIIDGHYDTKNGVGANDNGSGTALLLELARILKDVETEYSIKFIHFTVEEVGLVGSQYYVDSTVIPENLDILLVFNIDEVGGINGMPNDTIVCEEDQDNPPTNNAASTAATIVLANCMELYSPLVTEISNAYASDYMPFEENGKIITGLYEKNESPFTHSPNDILANMDVNYVYEVTQGALGAALEFAIAFQDFTEISEESDAIFNGLEFSLHPNPSDRHVIVNSPSLEGTNFAIEISDTSGELHYVQELKGTGESFSLDLSKLSTGTYIFSIKTANQYGSSKLILN